MTIGANGMRAAILLAGLSLFMAMPGAAKEPVRLAPSSKWHVNYSADSCRLGRSFGEDDDAVMLMLDRFKPSPIVYVTLTGNPVRVRGATRKVVFHFGPAERKQERDFTPGTMAGGTPAIVVHRAIMVAANDATWDTPRDEESWKPADPTSVPQPRPDLDPAREAAVTFFEIAIPGRPALLLETGSMGAPMEALRACTDDLLRGWGIDADAHNSLSRQTSPASDPASWLNSGDYPDEMQYRGYEGLVYFRLVVDPSGSPASCHIQQSTRPQEFDDAVCKGIMRRARFEPALDAAGNPVTSYYVNRARFIM